MNQVNEYRLKEIEQDIKNAEGNKRTGMVLMIVSIFMLWPLLIVGAIIYGNANSKINRLNEEKKRILFEELKGSMNDKMNGNGIDPSFDYMKGERV